MRAKKHFIVSFGSFVYNDKMSNLYVRIINDVINHIEDNIADRLTLQNISDRFHLSAFHFSRIFSSIVGTSIKQYVLGRKLAVAAERLADPKNTVTDIAFDLGFDYPEVLSRNFKKCFGITPTVYRQQKGDIVLMPRATIIERDIANFGGILTLTETYKYLSKKDLYGIFIEADENADGFLDKLQSTGEKFLTDERYYSHIKNDNFYTVVNCLGDDSGKYSVFYGGELAKSVKESQMRNRSIPAGWYASFVYYGEMPQMLNIVNRDFYRWVITKEIELNPNGIGMVTIYDRQDMKNLQMLIPVKQPK